MDWDKLITSKRDRDGSEEIDKSGRSPFNRDFDRVVYSSAFRRLQHKTQVVPLPGSDFVRTRLTHSLESSCLGRSLGTIIGESICNENNYKFTKHDIGAIVAAACLAHDIGNPPFGHSGEEAIQHFFHCEGQRYLDCLEPHQRYDLQYFEGNAQGFRVLTKLQRSYNVPGLFATYSTLGAFTKYPQESFDRGQGKSIGNIWKKSGFLQAEKDDFSEVFGEMGVILKEDSPMAYARHPLAFLVEAADDIAFQIADFEDGFRRKIVRFEEAKKKLMDVIKCDSSDDTERALMKSKKIGSKTDIDRENQISYLRAIAIRASINLVSEEFKENVKKILKGKYEGTLVKNSKVSKGLEEIFKYSKEHIYNTKPVLEIEAAGFEVLGGLLEALIPCVVCEASSLNSKKKKLRELIPRQHLLASESKYERILGVTDFVSGMTDNFAISTYRKIKGISLPAG